MGGGGGLCASRREGGVKGLQAGAVEPPALGGAVCSKDGFYLNAFLLISVSEEGREGARLGLAVSPLLSPWQAGGDHRELPESLRGQLARLPELLGPGTARGKGR